MAIVTHESSARRTRVWTAGSGAPVVFLHGFEHHPGDASFLGRLAATRRVLAPEHPGYGESTPIDPLDGLLDVVLHLRELITSWDPRPVDLIGHCLGGMFAAELAALCPHVVRRLVLIGSYGLWLDDQPMPDPFSLSEAELAGAKWHDPESAAEPTIFKPVAEDPYLAPVTRNRNLAMASKFLWPLPDRGLKKRLAYIRSETLVVHGESDGLIPLAHAEALAAAIPDARLAVVPEAGHLPMVEQEDAFLDVVLPFLSDD